MGNIDSLQEEIFQIQSDISTQTAESVRLTEKANTEYVAGVCLLETATSPPTLLCIDSMLCCVVATLYVLLIPVFVLHRRSCWSSDGHVASPMQRRSSNVRNRCLRMSSFGRSG